jgi:hypothetical protein
MKTTGCRQESLESSKIGCRVMEKGGKRQKGKGKREERGIHEIFTQNSPVLSFLSFFPFVLCLFALIFRWNSR